MTQNLTTSAVEFPSNGEKVVCYLARPSSRGAKPGVVVIQEWWGVDDHIRDITNRIAREGYVGIAPDLYTYAGHKTTKDADEAARLMEDLRYDTAMRYLNGAVEYLKSLDSVQSDRIGTLGFCMGGGYSLLMACLNKSVTAAVAFYGQIINEEPSDKNPVNPLELIPQMHCPLLYIHAGADEWITLDHANQLEEAMKKHGKEGEVKSYLGAPHAFFNDTQPDIYRPKEAKDAWRRTLSFLGKHLAG